MTEYFRDTAITLNCPKCGHESEEKIGRLETSPNITCPSCGTVIQYEASDLRAKMRDVDKAIDKFRATLSKFNKR